MAYKHITYANMETFAAELKNKYAKKTEVTAVSDRVTALEGVGAQANVLEGVKVNGIALAIAEKMVDILIASGTANGTISVAGADVAVKGLAALAYKAEISEAELSTALKAVIDAKAAASDVTALTTRVTAAEGSITTLNGDETTEGSVKKQVSDAVAKIVSEAPEAYDTLKEISDWISGHAENASAMNSQITTNKNDIANLAALVGSLPDSATSTTVVAYIGEAIAALNISDYAKTADVTSAISTALADYYTKAEANSTFVKVADIETVTDAEMKALLDDTTE